MRKWLFGAVVCLTWLALSERAYAQNAQITGVVKDSSGAVIPGATVTAKNEATGIGRTETTDGGGNYRLVALPPGTYVVTVELQGFTAETRPDIVLVIDQTATINMTLKPAVES